MNHALVHLKRRDELFPEICRIVVECGGFLMAWVGWHDPQTEQLVPVAKWGDDWEYLSTARLYADDRPEGLGPVGVSFRSGTPYICNDFERDPTIAPWRKLAKPTSIRASATFPIRLNQAVVGVFGVYASELDYFQEKEIMLLNGAAADISFALDNFAREEDRLRSEANLRTVQSQFATVVQHLEEGLVVMDAASGGTAVEPRGLENAWSLESGRMDSGHEGARGDLRAVYT